MTPVLPIYYMAKICIMWFISLIATMTFLLICLILKLEFISLTLNVRILLTLKLKEFCEWMDDVDVNDKDNKLK